MRGRESPSWRRGAIASAAIHAALALVALGLAPPRASGRPPEPAEIEIALGPFLSAIPPVPVPVPDPVPLREPAATRTTPPEPAPRAPHARRPSTPQSAAIASIAPSSESLAPAATSPSSETSPAPEGPGTRECAPGEGTFLVPIDPRSVAARALAEEGRQAAAGATEADAGPAARVGGGRHAGRQPDLERALAGGVRGPDLSERPPPVVRPSADGGYDVEGIRLRAHVAPDGRISFQDGPPIEDVGPSFIPGNRESGVSGSAGVGFRFDLNDGLWNAVGQDPLRTERQYLLRETEQLRNRLATRARRVDEERAILALGEELRAIAADRSLSPAQRREEVFALWDDCSTDAIGERARTLVEDFIRERFPAGTALAYTSGELVRLNRGRATGRPFDPYRGTPDAGPADGGA